jgi:hypothetical protein
MRDEIAAVASLFVKAPTSLSELRRTRRGIRHSFAITGNDEILKRVQDDKILDSRSEFLN